MEGEYNNNNRSTMRENLSLGEDGPVAGDGAPGVEDRGLFGRHQSEGEYASEVGGGGYGARPPMPYDGGYGGGNGNGNGEGYGAYEQQLPPPELANEGGYGGSSGYGGAPPAYGSDVGDGVDDRGLLHGRHHGHDEKHGDDDLDEQRRHKHFAEAAAAAAVGYGLYEREQKEDAEEELERLKQMQRR